MKTNAAANATAERWFVAQPPELTEEELNVFFAETNEQLQTLDEGLMQLEIVGKELARSAGKTPPTESSAELLQSLFRAAHTLKGSSGMLGNQSMVRLTHALESALDGVRKRELAVTSPLVDTCLEAVDVLRRLCQEAIGCAANGEAAAVCHADESLDGASTVLFEEIGLLEERFAEFTKAVIKQPGNLGAFLVGSETVTGSPLARSPAAELPSVLNIQLRIAADCAAPAARIFLISQALQGLGEITSQSPAPEAFEEIARSKQVTFGLIPNHPIEKICRVLTEINDVTEAAIQPLQMPQAALASPPPNPISNNGKNRAKDFAAAEKTVRASVERLDHLLNLTGELITGRNRLLQLQNEMNKNGFGRIVEGRPGAPLAGSSHELLNQFAEAVTHISRTTDELQAEVMGLRMLPISNLFQKFPRMVRELTHQTGKKAQLILQGEETELDRTIIETIRDPLIHLLRNAIDHGLESPQERLAAGKPETGVIRLSARNERGQINISIEDDGRGINLAQVKASAVEKGLLTAAEAQALSDEKALELIFHSGLSTAKNVTEISGRGIGMDIVRANVESLNGAILVNTTPGRGAQIQILLPLTLAILHTLLVQSGKSIFALPLAAVTKTLWISPKDVQTIQGHPTILLRGDLLPLVALDSILGLSTSRSDSVQGFAVVAVHSGKSEIGLVVDSLLGDEQVMVKSLGHLTGKTPGVSGAAILGDGQIALIVDVMALSKIVCLHQETVHLAT